MRKATEWPFFSTSPSLMSCQESDGKSTELRAAWSSGRGRAVGDTPGGGRGDIDTCYNYNHNINIIHTQYAGFLLGGGRPLESGSLFAKRLQMA